MAQRQSNQTLIFIIKYLTEKKYRIALEFQKYFKSNNKLQELLIEKCDLATIQPKTYLSLFPLLYNCSIWLAPENAKINSYNHSRIAVQKFSIIFFILDIYKVQCKMFLFIYYEMRVFTPHRECVTITSVRYKNE